MIVCKKKTSKREKKKTKQIKKKVNNKQRIRKAELNEVYIIVFIRVKIVCSVKPVDLYLYSIENCDEGGSKFDREYSNNNNTNT